MAKQETEILSFSYPMELKKELQTMAEKEGYKLATYIKRIIILFLEKDESTEDEAVKEIPVKTSKKKRRKK